MRFVIFNTDQHFAGLQNMRENADAFYDLCRAILHQTVVGSYIRFTFRGIDDERLDLITTAAQFGPGREASAAQTRNTKLMDAFN